MSFNPESYSSASSRDQFVRQYEVKDDDKGVRAEFYKSPVFQPFKSKEAGREIVEMVDFIRIRVIGNDKSAVERPANEQDKLRFAELWKQYSAGQAQEQSGTPLDQLPGMMFDTIAHLKTIHIHTVENLAQVTDTHGPNIGLGWRTIRKQAQEFLDKRRADPLMQAKLEEQANHIAELKAMVEKLSKKKGD